MPTTITAFETHDIRFPTSQELDGSDAMNPDPDYSAAYVVLRTDSENLSGYGMTFTIGRGNELCVAGIQSLARLLVGVTVESLMAEPVTLYRKLTGDSQLRWVGPEKGVIHLAAAAVINAVWDLWARIHGKPVWQMVCDMSPQEFVSCVDFRYLTDAITPTQAIELLTQVQAGKAERLATVTQQGYPSYTTSAGWLGYSDEALKQKCEGLRERGWSHFKIKVGRDLNDDIRRCRVMRQEMGDESFMMIDANQVWDVPQAIEWIDQLAEFRPWFVEEPTSPDDILGHAAIAKAVSPIRVATGEMCHNRVMFKQFLQSGGMQVCQLDSCRLGGVNEVLAVLLMAARYNVPVCPHAGGVGLCEYVQHLSIIDYVCVSADMEGRITEYSDHLHEHMVTPVNMQNGRYMSPTDAGYSVEFTPDALNTFSHSPSAL
ncbi:MAG TPA: L-fuconate dehydratase [Planctomycetes bacterium]|nr:L-fuconate dehydratase [Fuerstiella sp.]HIK92608.1 L-fuconate dehydratase [Planctomycetota bacterium]